MEWQYLRTRDAGLLGVIRESFAEAVKMSLMSRVLALKIRE